MNKNNLNEIKSKLIKASGGKLSEKDVDSLRSGNLSAVNRLLSKEEKQTLLNLLKDKSAAKKILNSPQVRDILGNK